MKKLAALILAAGLTFSPMALDAPSADALTCEQASAEVRKIFPHLGSPRACRIQGNNPTLKYHLGYSLRRLNHKFV